MRTLFSTTRFQKILGSVFLCLCFFASEARAGSVSSACLPTVEVQGEDLIVFEIKKLLLQKDIGTKTKENCPRVLAKIERKDMVFLLRIEDRYGRVSERFIVDAKTAAALLESWVRTDLSAPLLSTQFLPLEVFDKKIEIPAKPLEKATIEHSLSVPPTRVDPGDILFPKGPIVDSFQKENKPSKTELSDNLSVSAEVSLGTNGSIGLGTRFSGCVLLGEVCPGLIIRATAENEILQPRSVLGYLSTEALFSIDFYTEPSSLSIIPGIGFGVGAARVPPPPNFVREPGFTEVGAFRADAHILGIAPLGKHIDFDFGFSLGMATLSQGVPSEISEKPRFYFRSSLGFRWKP